MRWGTAWRAAEPRSLLPGPLRGAGIVLLVTCVAVFAILATLLAGEGSADRLDAALDPRIQAGLGRFPRLLSGLPHLGGLPEVTLMTAALALAFVAIRSWRGATLTLLAVPGAVGLTEYVLKPYVGGPLDQAFPSGHATSSFTLAALGAILLGCRPLHRLPRTLRFLLVLAAFLIAAAVAAAMVANGAHTFTDVVAGATVGTGIVLACALILDLAAPSPPIRSGLTG
jgi:membrane-associated phospholipid phosphatase